MPNKSWILSGDLGDVLSIGGDDSSELRSEKVLGTDGNLTRILLSLWCGRE